MFRLFLLHLHHILYNVYLPLCFPNCPLETNKVSQSEYIISESRNFFEDFFYHCMAVVSRCFSSLVIKDCNAVWSTYTGMYLNYITHVYLKRMQYYFIYSEYDRQRHFFFLLKGSIIQRVLCFFCFFLISMCTVSNFAVQPLWLLCSNAQSEKDAQYVAFIFFFIIFPFLAEKHILCTTCMGGHRFRYYTCHFQFLLAVILHNLIFFPICKWCFL